MRRIMAILIAAVLSLPVSAKGFQVSADLMSLDSLLYGSVRIDAEIGYRFNDLRVSFPVRYSHSVSYSLDFLEGGIFISSYPFENCGFFVGASLLRLGYFWGYDVPDDRLMVFSEVSAGWTISFPYSFIEPRISFTDALSQEEGKLSMLGNAVGQYRRFRISLLAGFEF